MSSRHHRLRFIVSSTFIASGALWASVLAAVVGCSAGDEGADGPPDYSNSNPLSPGAGGSQSGSSGSGGAGGARPVGGGAGTGGVSGTSGSGGTAAVAGSGGGGAVPGTGGQSNNPGTGGTGNPGVGGTGPGGNGGFVSVDVNGGASANFICPQGATFGDPLAGMGQVQQFGATQPDFFAFLEGPIWVGNRLFFSDNASNPERIFQSVAPFTAATLFMANSGSNGLALDNQDQLLLADQAGRRVTRVSPTNAQVTGTLLPAGNIRPNDLILRSDENLYFTEPASGLYRLSPAGQLTGPIRGNNVPNSANGVVLSPDENTLYAGDVNASFIAKFALLADGTIDAASAVRFTGTRSGTVDGMAVDCAGNVYAGTANGVEVYTAGGQFIGTIASGQCSNATFGGADRKTLFITSGNLVKFVTLAVPGLPD